MEFNVKHSDIQTAFIVICGLILISPMFPTFVSSIITFSSNIFAGTFLEPVFSNGIIVLSLASITIIGILITIFKPKNL